MRMLLKARVPVEAGNEGISSGKLPETVQRVLAELRPEAAYFAVDGGRRGCFIVFDMQDASQLPAACEPLFQNVLAEVELTPVMTAEDLQKGLEALRR